MSLGINHRSRKKLVVGLLVAAGISLLIVGAGVSAYQHFTNRANASFIAQEIVRANSGQLSSLPSTNKPDDSAFAGYRVAPEEPRYIFIDKISVRAMVKPMGLTSDNTIEAPKNVHDAGWYKGSAKPGTPGAMIIDGHVANWASKSVFHDLKSLRPGDIVSVERGDGLKLDYRVVRSQSYDADKVDMKSVMAPINPSLPGLNLITCDGKVVKGNEFEKRLVVFAEQL